MTTHAAPIGGHDSGRAARTAASPERFAPKGHDYDKRRPRLDADTLRERGGVSEIRRRGVDRSDRLGRHRWKIEHNSLAHAATDA